MALTLLVAAFAGWVGLAQAASYTWTPTAAGTTYTWTGSTNWSSGFPNAIDDTANLNINLTGAQTISLNQVIMIGTLNLGDTTSSYVGVTLTNGTGGSLTFDVSSGNAALTKATVGNSAVDTISATITLNDNLDISNAAPTGGLTLSGVIGDGGAAKSIKKLGAGTLSLSGANTFSGGLTINAGTVTLNNTNSAGTGTITLGDTTGGNNNSATLNLLAGNSATYNNNITVAAGTSGILTMAQGNSAGSVTNSGTVSLNNNLTLFIDNLSKYITFTGLLTETSIGSPSLTIATATNATGHLVFSGGVVVGTGGLTFANNGTTSVIQIDTHDITGTGSLTFSGSGSGGTTISGAIGSSVTAVVQNNPNSTLALNNAANAFTGGLFIKAGTVSLGDVNAANGVNNTITLGDATVGANATLLSGKDGVVFMNPITVAAGNGTRTITTGAGTANSGFFGGLITLNNDLIVYHPDSGNPRYVSLTNNITGTGNISIQNAIVSNLSPTFNNITLSGASINNSGAITNNGTGIGPAFISGNIGPLVTSVVQNSGTSPMTLSGANTYTGPTAILAGTLTISGTGSLGGGNYGGAITNSGTLVYSNTAVQTLSGVMSGGGTLTQQAGALLINGANTNTGMTTVSAGTLGGIGTLAGPVFVAAGGLAVISPSLGAGGSNTLTLSSAAANALTLNGGANLNFALSPAVTNDLIQITGGLVLNGANYITLSFPQGAVPAGTYTLMTYASQTGSGTLALNGSYPNASLNVGATSVTLTVVGGGISGALLLTWKGNVSGNWDTSTLNWTNGSAAVAYAEGNAVLFNNSAIAGKYSVTGSASPGSVTVSNTTAYTIVANIGGSGYLLKQNTGTATLIGTNTYTGPTTISAGMLTLGGAGQLGGGSYAGAIVNNGTFTCASSAPNTLSGGINGSGAITATGTGLLTLSGVNTMGSLTVSTGKVALASNPSTVSGAVTVNGVGSSLAITNGGQLFSGASSIGNGSGVNNNTVTVVGPGSLWDLGAAALTVGATNSTGNALNVMGGGILQFTTSTPTITINSNALNGIAITNGTISFRNAGVVNLTNNWVNSGVGTNRVAWQGNNTLRLDGSTGTNTLGRPYQFDTNLGSTNFVSLELLGTCGVKGSGLTIGTNGTMLVSNATATITGTLTNNGTVILAGPVSFTTNLAFTGTGSVVQNWSYTASTCSVVQVAGTLVLPPTMTLNISGSGPLPPNPVLFSWQGTAPTTSWNITPSGKYKVNQVGNTFVLSASSGGCLLMIQ